MRKLHFDPAIPDDACEVSTHNRKPWGNAADVIRPSPGGPDARTVCPEPGTLFGVKASMIRGDTP